MTILFDILRRDRRGQGVEERCPSLPPAPFGRRLRVMWIACTDHQPAPEALLDRRDLELITHRNLANQVRDDDRSVRSTVEYAVKVWNVDCIVVCGHYKCTGLQLALRASADRMDCVDHWVDPLRELLQTHRAELALEPDFLCRLDRLAELNVRAQVQAVRRLPAVQARPYLPVLGWVFDAARGTLADCLKG